MDAQMCSFEETEKASWMFAFIELDREPIEMRELSRTKEI
jgi:hypothetical protein